MGQSRHPGRPSAVSGLPVPSVLSVLAVLSVLSVPGLGSIAGEPALQSPAWVSKIGRMGFGTPGEVAAAAGAGMQLFHTNLVWPYYPLARDGGGLSPADAAALRRLVADCRRHGLRLVLGLPPFPPVSLVHAHPEWRVRPLPDAALPEPKEEDLGGRVGCNNGPWGDYLIEVCAELMRDYGLDGYSFDGNYQASLCWCAACESDYRTFAGKPLPPRVDLDSLDYREYLRWRGDRLAGHYRKLRERLRAVNRDAVVMSWTVNAGRYGHLLTSPRAMPLEVNRLFDLPMQEWWLDESNRGSSVAPAFGAAYLRAVGPGPCASEPYLMSRGRPYGTDSFPRHERLVRTLLALSQGNVSAQSLGWPGHRESTADCLKAVRDRESWVLGTEPWPWCGLLVSESTRQFVAYRNIAERFLPHVYGAFRMGQETHLPLSLLAEPDLTPAGLRPYRALILPGVAALSGEQCDALAAWVEEGGGLVVTAEAGVCDERGVTRERPAWQSLLGVRQRPPAPAGSAALTESYWQGREQVGRLLWEPGCPLETPALSELVPDRRVMFRGPRVSFEPLKGSRVVMSWQGENAASAGPAVTVREVGKGRVVYLGVGLDAALWSYAYPYQRLLFANAVEWAAGGSPPVAVEAPMCVQATWFQRGNRRILHLFNGLNSAAGHGNPTEEVPLREEAVPIHGIRVRFQQEPGPATLEPGGRKLRPRRDGKGWVVTLPPLEIHTMLVTEERPRSD